MQTTSQPAQANCTTLDPHIDRAAQLKLEIAEKEAELKVYLEGIKSGLKAAKVERYVTKAGNEALLSQRTIRSWLVEKLQKVLDPKRFRLLCPRTPQAKELSQILEADPVLGAQLSKGACFTSATQDVLTVRPAAEKKGPGVRGQGSDVDIDAMSGTGREGSVWPRAAKSGD